MNWGALLHLSNWVKGKIRVQVPEEKSESSFNLSLEKKKAFMKESESWKEKFKSSVVRATVQVTKKMWVKFKPVSVGTARSSCYGISYF